MRSPRVVRPHAPLPVTDVAPGDCRGPRMPAPSNSRLLGRPGAGGLACAGRYRQDGCHMSTTIYERARLDLCYDSLYGLSVGDALGAQFFMVGRSVPDLKAGKPPAGPWEWTDDTEMACSVVAEL